MTKAAKIRKSGERWKKVQNDYECKGRVRADKGARPSFCYRVRSEDKPEGKVHVVQLISRRSGKPIGFISTDYRLDADRAKAHEWNYLNKFAAGMFIRDSILSSRLKRPLDKDSRALVKSIEEAARKVERK